MTIAFTGHRPDKLGKEFINRYEKNRMYQNYGPISKKIFNAIEDLMTHYKAETIISGMAIGIDQIVAHAALHMGIPLIAAIPFKGQEQKWSPESQKWYNYLVDHAKKVIVSPGGYSAKKMQIRNEWMVDHCDLLIGVWDGSHGGTYNCLTYAKETGTPVIVMHPITLEIKQL